eukprot:2927702-Rhodomonas_salina.2
MHTLPQHSRVQHQTLKRNSETQTPQHRSKHPTNRNLGEEKRQTISNAEYKHWNAGGSARASTHRIKGGVSGPRPLAKPL